LTVVDVTDENQQDPVRMGDEVVILGPQGNDRITIEELLEWIGAPGSSETQLLFSLMARNPKKIVEGVAANLHPRHLSCGLCLDEESGEE
jgi:alanine racemase